MRRALVLVLASCGRIDFAALPADALVGHDEDGDGIPDVIDPCPHVAGDRADRDGDGVGDACDPNPDAPIDHWVVFSTMQPGDQPFDDASQFEQQADSLHTTIDTNPAITRTWTNVRIDLGFDIHALVGTGQHQVAAGLDGGPIFYFGELNDNPPLEDVSVVSYDMTNGYLMYDPVTYPGIHPGVGFLRLDADVTPSPVFHLLTGWTDELYQSNAATPQFVGGHDIRFVTNGLDIDLRYLAVIASD